MTPELEKDLSRRFSALVRAEDATAIAAQSWPEPEAMLARRYTQGSDDFLSRCGVLGFSFPIWRFLSQGVNGDPSLLERFGMVRLSRATDLRDGSLADPARDEFGIGYGMEIGGYYIEYRRAYLLCARVSGDAAGCLVIRNNSFFFGRDRLPRPLLTSIQRYEAADWQSLTPSDFASDSIFSADLSLISQAIFVQLLQVIETHERRLQGWLTDEGLPYLCGFLRAKLAQGRAMPFVGWVADGCPPWRPIDAQPLDNALVARLEKESNARQRTGFRLTLLSGPNGDLPAI